MFILVLCRGDHGIDCVRLVLPDVHACYFNVFIHLVDVAEISYFFIVPVLSSIFDYTLFIVFACFRVEIQSRVFLFTVHT